MNIVVDTNIAFNATIWSEDKHFKEQKAVEVMTTQELVNLTRQLLLQAMGMQTGITIKREDQNLYKKSKKQSQQGAITWLTLQ